MTIITTSPDIKQQHIPTLLGYINVHISNNGTIEDKKKSMIFWPSLIMNGQMWYSQIKYFSTKNYNCIAIDSPGHGQSETLTHHFTLEECCIVLRQILDFLHIEKIILIGNSWGGMMGGCFAAIYPSRIECAVLMNSTASAVPFIQKYSYYLLTNIMWYTNSVPSFTLPITVNAFTGKTTRATRPYVAEYIKKVALENNPRSVVYAMESVVPMRRDMHHILSAVQCPILVIAGKEDATFTNEETKNQAKAIPKAQFKVLYGLAHLIGLEDPDIVNHEIEEFINSLK
jgi:3-oxoadipate enol-lactonase